MRKTILLILMAFILSGIAFVNGGAGCPDGYGNYTNFSRFNPNADTVNNVSLFANFTINENMNYFGNFSSFRVYDDNNVELPIDFDYNNSVEVRIWFQDIAMETEWNNYTLCYNFSSVDPVYNTSKTFPDSCFVYHSNNLSVNYLLNGATTPLITDIGSEDVVFNNGTGFFNGTLWNEVSYEESALEINDTGCPTGDNDHSIVAVMRTYRPSQNQGNNVIHLGRAWSSGVSGLLLGESGKTSSFYLAGIIGLDAAHSENVTVSFVGRHVKTNEVVGILTSVNGTVTNAPVDRVGTVDDDNVIFGTDDSGWADKHAFNGELWEAQIYASAKSSAWQNITLQNFNDSCFRIGASGIGNVTPAGHTDWTFNINMTNDDPLNNSVINAGEYTFNCSAKSNNTNIDTLILWIDGVEISGTACVGCDFLEYTSHEPTGANGTHSYFCNATLTTGESNVSSNYTYIVDTAYPLITGTINISNFTTTVFPNSTYWAFNVSDVDLDSCYYNSSDNATYTEVTCNQSITTAWLTEGNKLLQYCVNDTSGRETCSWSIFNISYFNITQKDSINTVGEGNVVVYTLTINKTGIAANYPQTTANLSWNSTIYPFDSKIVTANSIKFIKNLIIPLGSGTTGGNVVYWNWSYTVRSNTDTLFDKNVTSQEDTTVYTISVDNCSALTVRILNITLYDEETKRYDNLTNQSIEINVLLSTFSNSTPLFNYSTSVRDVNTTYICVPSGVLGFASYRMDVLMRYSSADHVTEFSYITAYNLSTTVMQNISLYDLKTADSTSFLVQYQDNKYLAVQGAVIDILRYYVGEGVYYSVEQGKTDSGGQTTLHLVTEDVIYKFVVRKEGVLLYESDPRKAICQATPCQINLYQQESVIPVGNYSSDNAMDYTWTFNKTSRLITFDFIIRNGIAETVRLNVTQWDGYDNNTICQDSITASSGTLTCSIPITAKNTTYYAYVWRNSDYQFVSSRIYSLTANAMDNFGYTGVIMTIILVLSLVLMAVISSPIAVVVFMIIGLIIAGMLAIFNMGSVMAVGSSALWLIIAGAILIWKINQRRVS